MRRLILLSLIVLLYPTLSYALETGDAYWGTFGGYQEGVFAEAQRTKYLGLTTTLYQPTLNWGDHRFEFIGFYRDNTTEEFELGYLSAAVRDLWLSPGYEVDAFLGDGFMQFITPTIVFEHLGLPSQSIRGLGTELHTDWGRTGVQAGRFTEGDFLFPGAVRTSEGELVGAYLELQGRGDNRLAAAVDYLTEDGEDRALATLYGNLSTTFGELRGASWYDSLSGQVAGVVGIRRSSVEKYTEAGFLHIPEDFNYLSKRSSLPTGQTLLFGTYRFDGVRKGYYLEGSGGKIDTTANNSWLYRGSLGGYYRTSLRDTISGSIASSYQDLSSGGSQSRFNENIRYSLRRSKWDNSIQLQATQFFDNPPNTEFSEDNRILRWLGEISSNYRAESWDVGGRVTLEYGDNENLGDETSALFRLEGRTAMGYGLTGGGFLQYGRGWREADRSEVYGGGMDVTFPLPGGWQVRTRIRAQRSNVFAATGALAGVGPETANTTIDLFAILERRHYWGEPAPVVGKFMGPSPKGVGNIKGRVFADLNENQVFDAGDKPLAGVLLRLDEGFVIETSGQGLYDFFNVSAGQHHMNLDPASFPIEYVNPVSEGLSFQIYPRDEKTIDWPLRLVETYALSPMKAQ